MGPLFDQYLALRGFAQGDSPQELDPYVDLVADVLHLAASRGVSYEQVLRRATGHYHAEANPPDTLVP